ncbi:hypothetical protein K2173_012318 [Erythroxylum novogranatense]|uniref:Uncharacterized protein n=1 Tax=Erythroxylum novogranatense TaxID=1862640 RepID=A0AAV8SC18_9ROSI|nr:hypothetical protein K2173_012318 [Erythroxylum novogranatense]
MAFGVRLFFCFLLAIAIVSSARNTISLPSENDMAMDIQERLLKENTKTRRIDAEICDRKILAGPELEEAGSELEAPEECEGPVGEVFAKEVSCRLKAGYDS